MNIGWIIAGGFFVFCVIVWFVVDYYVDKFYKENGYAND